MICLDNTDVIEGGASVDAVVDYQIHGLVGTTFTQLAAGVMGTTLTTALYTAGAAISVVSIILVNTHSSIVAVTLRLDPANGGNPRYLIPKTVSLGIGYSLHTDGARIIVMDASGRILKGYTVHASDHQNEGSDEISIAGLSGLLADDQHVLDAEVLAVAAAKGINADITSMTGLDNKGIPEAKVISTKIVVIKCIADDTVLTTGDGKAHFTVPIELNGMNLISVGAHTYTVSSSGLPTFQIHNLTDAVDMLSTLLTIDANEKDSKDAATAAVINGAADDVATGDELRFDCDVAGTGTKGMEIRLGLRLP